MVSSAQAGAMTDVGVGDLGDFLVGVWKRNLQVRAAPQNEHPRARQPRRHVSAALCRREQARRFGGGFEVLRASNAVVVIEDAPEAAAEPGTR